MEKTLMKKQRDSVNLLIVEDDPIQTFILDTMLRDNFTITSVDNGYAALEAIETQKFDVILMDINLGNPVMDGITTMRKIKFQRKHKNIKIIAVTASSDAKEWFIKQGFDGHYLKPLIKKEIEEEINRLTNQFVNILRREDKQVFNSIAG